MTLPFGFEPPREPFWRFALKEVAKAAVAFALIVGGCVLIMRVLT